MIHIRQEIRYSRHFNINVCLIGCPVLILPNLFNCTFSIKINLPLTASFDFDFFPVGRTATPPVGF